MSAKDSTPATTTSGSPTPPANEQQAESKQPSSPSQPAVEPVADELAKLSVTEQSSGTPDQQPQQSDEQAASQPSSGSSSTQNSPVKENCASSGSSSSAEKQQQPDVDTQPSSNLRALNTATNGSDSVSPDNNTGIGPDEAKLKAILDRTGYSHEITSGQRKYGGPPPNWEGSPPASGCEVFVGKIPKDIFEDTLIELFEPCGRIWDLRLMVDPFTHFNRGYCFITFCTKEEAETAQSRLDGHEIRRGQQIKVNLSTPNLRLFVGNIPKSKSKDEIFQEFSKLTSGLLEVIVYSSPDDRKRNRGFCFLEYDSHKNASQAKRKLSPGKAKVWNCDILVDWADPQEEPDTDTMSKVKVLYVRNLVTDVSEQQLRELFEKHGSVQRVKKIKDYAFVHFDEREHALNAMQELNGSQLHGVEIEVSLAKPPSDRKKKEEVLRNRERRVMMMMQQRTVLTPGVLPRGGALLPPVPPPLPPPVAAAASIPPGVRGGRNNRNNQMATLSPAAYGLRNMPRHNYGNPWAWSQVGPYLNPSPFYWSNYDVPGVPGGPNVVYNAAAAAAAAAAATASRNGRPPMWQPNGSANGAGNGQKWKSKQHSGSSGLQHGKNATSKA